MHIIDQLLLGTITITGFTLFHVVSLVLLAMRLRRYNSRRKLSDFMLMRVLIFSVLFIILLHTIEAWGWALIYLYLGEFSSLSQALYFSVVTSTTLGFGDIVTSEKWQLFATFEAMQGLLLFGVTTAFLIDIMRRLFKEFDE